VRGSSKPSPRPSAGSDRASIRGAVSSAGRSCTTFLHLRPWVRAPMVTHSSQVDMPRLAERLRTTQKTWEPAKWAGLHDSS
jgi:hypothetical protein